MHTCKHPSGVWNEYTRAIGYNNTINLYNTVRDNEDFYIGDQWIGVKAPDLPKPVLNILKPSVNYFISTICSDDIGTQLNSFGDDAESEKLMRVFAKDIDRIMEDDKTKSKFREAVRDAAVTGDGILYWYWDDSIKTGSASMGDVRSDIIPNINVLFGNPYEKQVQKQPYVIVAQRLPVQFVREEAEANGIEDYDCIVPDQDSNQGEQGDLNNLVTVLVKFWKEDGTVRALKTTKTVMVREEWDTENKLYPVAWMRWYKKRSSYHGQAVVTGLIPNQITVNKLFAMYIKSVEMNAFPKIVYDMDKFRNGWSNRVGEAVGVRGDVGQAAVNVLRGGEVSYQVMDVIERCIAMTKDTIGANDAALGSLNPSTAAASAIIATQQASAAPLEMQRQEFFDFVEQCVLIILDFMAHYYGSRETKVEYEAESVMDPMTGMMSEAPKREEKERIDYRKIADMVRNLEVSVGSSAYWSELAQMQTMDNLLQAGIITDTVTYLESIPDKWLPNKQELIESAKKHLEEQQAAQGMQGMPGMMPQQSAPTGKAGEPVPDAGNMFNSML